MVTVVNKTKIKKAKLSKIFKYNVKLPAHFSTYRQDIKHSFLPESFYKRGRGRPRKAKIGDDGMLRQKGRPIKNPVIEKEEVKTVGRPRIHPNEEEIKADKAAKAAKKKIERTNWRRTGRR